MRLTAGVILLFVAVLLWGCLFYAPFAFFETTTFRMMGTPPPFMTEMIFTLLVAVGNQIMYVLCSMISQEVGFRSSDNIQACYVVLYTAAVLVNTLVDVAVVVVTSYFSMVAQGVRTREGTTLDALPSAAAIVQSYPMMKVTGKTLYDYNFPSCFLIPFVGEAVFTVLLPYYVGKQIVGKRTKMTRNKAEACLAPIPMDLSRYGDILVNLTLATLCFFTASGWILRTLMGLLLGNLFIYVFDQFRVLRHIENFFLGSGQIDSLAQVLLIIPCGILATAVTWQLHSIGKPAFLQEVSLWTACFYTCTLHSCLHGLALMVGRAYCCSMEHTCTDKSYRECAAEIAPNYFNTNPVHCLRSKYIHRQDPPCIYCMKGKEYVLEANGSIGLFYVGNRVDKTWSHRASRAQVPEFMQNMDHIAVSALGQRALSAHL